MKINSLLLAGIAVACAAPVAAQRIAVPVSIAGLDLSSPAGRATLDQRVAGAAGTICGEASNRELANLLAVRRCRREAIASARPQVEQAIAASNKAVQVAIAR